MRNITFVLLTAYLSQSLWAQVSTSSLEIGQETSTPMVQDEIIVEGDLAEDQLKDNAVKTEVLNKTYISDNNLKSMTEVIERIPGVVLEENTGRSGSSAVMQGLGQDQVLVMIDGIPQLQTTSSGFDLTQLNTAQIEKVEVVKGGSSALYGSHAIGGVINILTNKKVPAKTKVNLDVLTGTSRDQDSPNSFLSGGFSTPLGKNFVFKLDASRNNQKSTDLDESTINRDGSDINTTNIKAVARYANQSGHAFFIFRNRKQETLNIDTLRDLSGTFTLFENRSELDSKIYTTGASYQLTNDLKLKLNVQREDNEDALDLLNNPSDPNQFTIAKANLSGDRVEGSSELFLNDYINLQVGAVFQREELSQISDEGLRDGTVKSETSIDNKKRSTVDVYAQSEIFIGNNIEISPGARFQKDSRFASSFSPKVNTKIELPSIKDWTPSLRFSVGTGYRTPSLKENYYLLNHIAIGNYIVEGNPNLIPEESISYQGGLELTKGDSWSLYSNFFLNRVENMIDRRESSPEGGTRRFTTENFENVETRGVELRAQYRSPYNVVFDGSYGFTETQDQNTGLALANRPQVAINFNTQIFATDNLNFIAHYRYVGDQFSNEFNSEVSPAYETVDLRANFKVNKALGLYAGINNVFDVTRNGLGDGETQDEEIRDARPVVGRYFFLGVRFDN